MCIRQKLIDGQIDIKKILTLPKNHTIEDFVNRTALLDATNEILNNFQKQKLTIKASAIPNVGSIKFIENKYLEEGLTFPSKVLIAERLVLSNSAQEIIKQTKKNTLAKILQKVVDTLK